MMTGAWRRGVVSVVSILAAILWAILWAPTAARAELPPEALRLERALEAVSSIRADFMQIRTVALSGEEIQAVGMLAYRPPHDFRIAYETPRRDELVIRGDSLWVVMSEENQAQRYAFEPDAPGNEIFLLFGGHREALDEAFDVSQESWAGHEAALKLVPRNRDPGYPIEEMRLLLRSDGLPQRLFFREVTGDDVVFTFTHIERDPADIDELLELKLPPGIEIIDASPTGMGDAPGIDPGR